MGSTPTGISRLGSGSVQAGFRGLRRTYLQPGHYGENLISVSIGIGVNFTGLSEN